MTHVHCGSEQGTCFRIAGQLCPGGYEMKPVLSGSEGNFLVRCRAPQLSPAPAVCASPVVVAAKPHDAWPPSPEPWPATYPWPPPETSAVVQKSSVAPTTTPTEIDLGY